MWKAVKGASHNALEAARPKVIYADGTVLVRDATNTQRGPA